MAFLDEMSSALGDGTLHTDADVIDAYRRDRTTWLEPGMPCAVALPTRTSEVAGAVRVAADHGVPVVPRGAGSSLCGGSQGIDGAVTLSLERMSDIIEIDAVDQLVTVEPGVLNAEISEATRAKGLFYPPDPASKAFCSIGGNIATNAGGLCCVKYGVTRNYVQRLEVVLADGTVIETGHDTVKGVAGLDLTGLFVGSEGTLGIVTKAKLRLRPLAEGTTTMVSFFPTLGAAGAAVAAITASGVTLSLLEIMDRATVQVVDDATGMGLDRSAAALLIAQSDAAAPLRTMDMERTAELCDAAGASYTTFTEDPMEADGLLQARRLAGPTIEALGEAIWDDVGVPRSKVPHLIGRIEEIAEQRDTAVYTFGHAGDGNMHPTLLAPRGDDDARQRALAAFDDIIEAAIDLGGVITGEHGVGRVKAPFLERVLGAENMALQRRIKRTFDPDGILNPGRWI